MRGTSSEFSISNLISFSPLKNFQEESRPLLEVLRNLDGWPLLNPDRWNRSNFDLIDTLIKIKNLGYSHLTLFSIHPGVDITNNTNYLINVSASTVCPSFVVHTLMK